MKAKSEATEEAWPRKTESQPVVLFLTFFQAMFRFFTIFDLTA